MKFIIACIVSGTILNFAFIAAMGKAWFDVDWFHTCLAMGLIVLSDIVYNAITNR